MDRSVNPFETAMNNIRTFTANVTEFELLRNTRNGGKRYRVTWTDGATETQPDAQVAYMINEQPGMYEITTNSRGLIIRMRPVS